MRFARIELTNFRSFGPGTTVIEFPEGENLLAVVGANNAGKSNLLAAARLVLGRRRYDPEPSDFHRLDVTHEMQITLHLREHLLRETIFHGESRVAAFHLRAWQSDQPGDRGQLKSQHYCLDEQGKTYNPPAATPRGKKTIDPSAAPVRRLPPAARDILPQLGRVHYIDPSLYRAFDTTGLGPLALLLDLYREDFRSEFNTYEIPTSGEVVTRIAAFERLAERMTEILGTERLRQIQEAITRHLGRLLAPGAAGVDVIVGLPSADEILRTTLRLEVQHDPDSPVLPVTRLGAGYQSLLRLAIMRAYAELAPEDRSAVFLIEEPEAYLNPHLRRYFRTVLGELAAGGHDVFLTTHDPAFVSLAEYPTVLRLTKSAETTSPYRCTESLDFSYEALARKLRRGGNAEVLFASKAILCEGQDDAAVVRVLLERGGRDPDSRSISIVDCGGRENLPDYIRLLDALAIELLVVSDGDATTAAAKPEVARGVKAVQDAACKRLFRFREDIEHAFGTEKKRANVFQLVELAESVDLGALEDTDERRRLQVALLAFVPPDLEAKNETALGSRGEAW